MLIIQKNPQIIIFFFSTLNSCKVELKGPSQPIQGSIVMSARQLFAIIAAIAVVALLDETFFLIDWRVSPTFLIVGVYSLSNANSIWWIKVNLCRYLPRRVGVKKTKKLESPFRHTSRTATHWARRNKKTVELMESELIENEAKVKVSKRVLSVL